jgi:hypothetical protein
LREHCGTGNETDKSKSDSLNTPRSGVHFFLPPGPETHDRPVLEPRFLMAVNRKLLKERLNHIRD